MTCSAYIVESVTSPTGIKTISVGVLVSETDSNLPSYQSSSTQAMVQVTIDWGDGTSPYVGTPVNAPLKVNVAASIISGTGNVRSLVFDSLPVAGSLTLTGGSSPITIDYTTTTAQFSLALASVFAQTPILTGVPGNWVINFTNSTDASNFAISANSLVSPLIVGNHAYPSGKFTANVTATNFRAPTPDVVEISLPVSNVGKTTAIPAPIVFSPILPSDSGFPNEQQWKLDIGADLKVLASAVKLILITEPGDRLMMPEYGTALRQFIFDPNVPQLATEIQAEISRAILTWENRVTIDKIVCTKIPNTRQINVDASLISKLDNSRVRVNVNLER